MRRLYEEQVASSRVIAARKGLQEEGNDDGEAPPPAPMYPKRQDIQTWKQETTVPSNESPVQNDGYGDNAGRSHFMLPFADVELAEGPPVSHDIAIGAHSSQSPPSSPLNLSIQVQNSEINDTSARNNDAAEEYSLQDNDTLVSDITDSRTQVIEAFTRQEMADQLRQQFRSEMRADLQNNIVTAEVLDPHVESPGFWTKRRILVGISLVLLAIVGIVVGIVIAVTNKPPQENYLDGVTINGTNSKDRFGEFVVLSRDASTLAASAEEGHYIQVFRRNSVGAWNQFGQTLTFDYQQDNKFEAHLDLNQDGSILAVGQWNNDDAGTNAGYAVVYWYNGTMWTQLGRALLGHATKDHYGSSVALSDDGRTIAVGADLGIPSSDAKDAGYVRIFTFDGVLAGDTSTIQWLQLGSDLEGQLERDHFGMSIVLSADGRRIAVGAQGGVAMKGSVRVFDYDSIAGNWTQVGEPIEGDYEKDDADKVTMSADGSTLVIAADGDSDMPSYQGYRRTYKLDDSGTWRQLGEDLVGRSKRVSLSSDGTCILVGIPGYQNDQGRGELYRWSNDDSRWNQLALTVGDKADDRLGAGVTVSGNCSLFALGATRHDSPGKVFGYVRVYEVP